MPSLDLFRRWRSKVQRVAVRIGTGFKTWAGRILGRAEVAAMVEHTASLAVAGHLAPLATEVAAKDIGINSWMRAMRREIRCLYKTQYSIGRGGLAQMRLRDYNQIRAMLKDQYKYLDGFAQRLAQDMPTEDYVKWRSQLYANASREAFERGRSAVAEGLGADEVAWMLSPAEHCEDCLRWNGQGWQPIGPRGGFMADGGTLETWPGAADSACLTNCRCYLVYHNTKTGEEWAEAYEEGAVNA